ncbi:MAG: M24 family metallopeptidase, partial [Candidatus Hodarchaeales archaeon]
VDSNYSGIPREEIERRHARLRNYLINSDLSGILIFSNVEVYYYSGIGLEGVVYFPQDGEPVHLVKRNMELATKFSSISNIDNFGSLSQIFKKLNIDSSSKIGVELDFLPYSYVEFLKTLNKGLNLVNVTTKLRELRAVKTKYEISQIETAAKLVDRSFEYCVEIAKPEMTEIELAANLDRWLINNGHHGYITTRAFNSALLNYSYVIGRASSTLNIHFTPISGWGLSLKYPYGPSKQKIGSDPFFVDTCGNFNGYISDTTRTFILGRFDMKAQSQIEALQHMKQLLMNEMKPGINLGDVYIKAMDLAEELGIFNNFMGEGGDKVKFLGHGVGLELDELPILYAKGNQIEKGNILACEPKFIEKGQKVLGIEDTYA